MIERTHHEVAVICHNNETPKLVVLVMEVLQTAFKLIGIL